jgi:hypothetical protein
MKLVKTGNDNFVLALGKREKQLLLAVLNRYPLIPAGHQPLSKTPAAGQMEADQRLLEEALAEQRRENKRQLDRLLGDPQRLRDTETGSRLTLTSSEIEWLLQILNDVRVGSWLRLGSPEKPAWNLGLSETTAPHVWAMEMAGEFQMGLLKALRGSESA